MPRLLKGSEKDRKKAYSILFKLLSKMKYKWGDNTIIYDAKAKKYLLFIFFFVKVSPKKK